MGWILVVTLLADFPNPHSISPMSPNRLAALYDIHANLPALEAVLQEIRQAEVDQIVVGGDVLPGPMPRETRPGWGWS